VFDVGFSEIVVIGVVALIVIGPEKLPKTARTLGHLFGRLQRYVNDVKADINREMELDELRKLQQEVQSAAKDIEHSMNSTVQQVETGIRHVESELNAGAAGSSVANGPVQATPSATPAELAPPTEPPANDAPAATTAAEAARQASLPGFDRG
jgi:sec-independent protein translocase protein TatB